MAVNNDDFKSSDLLRSIEGHDKEIISLSTRIKELENKFGNHELTATTINEASKTQVKMQEMLAENFMKLLETNEKVKESIIALVNKLDRNCFYVSMKRFGRASWAIFLLFIGAAAKTILDKVHF